MSQFSFLDRPVTIVALAIAAALTGCSAVSDENGNNSVAPGPAISTGTSSSPTMEDRSSGASNATPAIAQYPVGDDAAGMDALFTGTVQIESGCVYVIDGRTRKLPVFPQGSVAWSEGVQAFTYRGKTYANGDTISLGGGEGNGGAELPASFFSTPPATGCDTIAMWMVSP